KKETRNVISVQGLNKTIQDKAIVTEINVAINKDRLTCIIGPNGAGKSKLISSITRLIDFEDGVIEIENKSISDYKSNELAKKLSILKQSNHTELNITVEQLVNFGRFPYSKGHLKQEDKEQVEYALELLQLKEIR